MPRVEWWLAPAYVFTILPPLSNGPRSHRHDPFRSGTMIISRTSVRMTISTVLIITSCHDRHYLNNKECPVHKKHTESPCWLQFQFRQLKPTTKRKTAIQPTHPCNCSNNTSSNNELMSPKNNNNESVYYAQLYSSTIHSYPTHINLHELLTCCTILLTMHAHFKSIHVSIHNPLMCNSQGRIHP
jgi:hypothetical protein